MPIGDKLTVQAGESGIHNNSASRLAVGSVQSDWIVANDDLTTAQGSNEETDPSVIDDADFHWVEVPAGVTKVLLRSRVNAAFTTQTTNPIVALVGKDGNGVPVRLDSPTDEDAAGITLTISTTATQVMDDGSNYYSPVSDASGYDLLGCSEVGIVVLTAANYTDGASNLAVQGLLKFLN